jgi:hypothetical protein
MDSGLAGKRPRPGMTIRSRDAVHPSFATPPSHEDSLPRRMIPKSAVAVFGQDHAQTKQGSGAPKGALSNQCPRQARLRAASLCGAPAFRRSRLRHSPPVPPDGSAPEPGFPRRRLTGVLPASRKDAAVKHAPCGPVFMPVDRGPEAARERIGRKNPRAGTAPRLRCFGMPSGTAPCTKRGSAP